MIRTAIVDDEPLAREGLRLRLATAGDIEIVGEAGDGEQALALVAAERPALLFLDVQMPGADGFAALAQIAAEHLPLVVFVTAHDAHAVRAFEVHALDYLLKPVEDARLAETLHRVRAELARGGSATNPERVAALLAAPRGAPAAPAAMPSAAPPARLQRFVVRQRGAFRLVPVESVHWVESAGNYIEIHTADGSHLVRMTLAEAEVRLGYAGFVRIHRKLLVRTAAVTAIKPTGRGDYRVRMQGGCELPMSRRFRTLLSME